MKDYMDIIDKSIKNEKREIVLTFNSSNNKLTYVVYKDDKNNLFGGKFRLDSDPIILETDLSDNEKKLIEKALNEQGVK